MRTIDREARSWFETRLGVIQDYFANPDEVGKRAAEAAVGALHRWFENGGELSTSALTPRHRSHRREPPHGPQVDVY